MGIKYTPDDLKRWLKADPQFGTQWTFILDRMAKLGHELKVEWLINRHFDGTSSEAFVDTGAKDQLEATSWAADALREWAGCGCGTSRMYFMDIARQWAKEGPGKGHTAKCLGSTLDFLTLVSRAGSMKPSMDMLHASAKLSIDVSNVFCWVFTDRIKSFDNKAITFGAGISSPKLGQGPPGLNRKFWNTDGAGTPAPDADEDQTHHFAGFFHLGATAGDGQEVVHTALSNTGDWSIIDQKVLNKGDYDLGFVAAKWGNSYSKQPRFIGKEVEAELT